jgi:DNA-binding CsgD family transcriptional regulator
LFVLLGREGERARIGALLGAARSGRSGALLLIGEPGIGKTTLLRDAATQADGLRVLEARGIESESELAFSGLSALLRPVMGSIETLPPPQAQALSSALALGQAAENAGADRFAVAAATLGVLAAAAEDGPLLAIVDDAHWLDGPSRDALTFAARRLGAEGIVLLLAARTDHPAFAGLERLELTGLEAAAARELIAESSEVVAPAVAETLLAASGGNPLALLELPGALSAEQRAGREPLEDPLPIGPSLEDAFRQRLDVLSEDGSWSLLVAAAGDSDALDPVATALGGDVGGLEQAEAAGLVTLSEGAVRFRHPLVRAVAYHSAQPATRRRAHRALADALAGDDGRRVWHLAAAATGPDEEVAALLEQTAAIAADRSGYAAAATALRRAALLTPAPSERARRLFLAGEHADLAGREDDALAALNDALRWADPLLRGRIQHLRGRILAYRSPREAIDTILVPEAARIEPLDASLAVLMLTDAALALPDDWDARPLLERAQAAAERSKGQLTPQARLILDTLLLTERLDSPAEWQWDALLELADDLAYAESLLTVALSASFEGEFEPAGELFHRVLSTARRSSALGVLASGLAMLVWHDYYTNQWTHAVAHGTEALELIEETGRVRHHASLLFMLGRLDAVSGREEECREHVARAVQVSAELALDDLSGWQAAVALGLLELGLGHPAEAVRHLEHGVCDERGALLPGVARGHGDLIEAYIRAGDADRAQAALAEWEPQARSLERGWALAVCARCAGLLAADELFEQHFDEALSRHEDAPVPFDTARTHLAYGERLRRAHRRVEAREHLREALAVFDRLGARPWMERTRTELAATGERLRKRDPYAAEELTAQELQVALVVAGGATNREAAAQLFVSPKTIEAHLGSIYRKLGVRSRTELAGRFASEGLATAAA